MNDPDHDLLIRVDERLKSLQHSVEDNSRRLGRMFIATVGAITALASVSYVILLLFKH